MFIYTYIYMYDSPITPTPCPRSFFHSIPPVLFSPYSPQSYIIFLPLPLPDSYTFSTQFQPLSPTFLLITPYSSFSHSFLPVNIATVVFHGQHLPHLPCHLCCFDSSATSETGREAQFKET